MWCLLLPWKFCFVLFFAQWSAIASNFNLLPSLKYNLGKRTLGNQILKRINFLCISSKLIHVLLTFFSTSQLLFLHCNESSHCANNHQQINTANSTACALTLRLKRIKRLMEISAGYFFFFYYYYFAFHFI